MLRFAHRIFSKKAKCLNHNHLLSVMGVTCANIQRTCCIFVLYSLHMKIHNKNSLKRFYAVLFALLTISILDLVLANIAQGEQYFWGYLFAVNLGLVLLVYFILGKPIFEFYLEDELIEIDSRFFSGLLNDQLFIKPNDLRDFKIKRAFLFKRLSIEYFQNGKIVRKHFSLSFLSDRKVKDLKKQLGYLVERNLEEEERQLFI